MMGRYPHFSGKPKLEDKEVCEKMLSFFDLGSMADRDYLTLSGGEKQRVQFARVMAQIDVLSTQTRPKYLFLDEPLTFLDI